VSAATTGNPHAIASSATANPSCRDDNVYTSAAEVGLDLLTGRERTGRSTRRVSRPPRAASARRYSAPSYEEQKEVAIQMFGAHELPRIQEHVESLSPHLRLPVPTRRRRRPRLPRRAPVRCSLRSISSQAPPRRRDSGPPRSAHQERRTSTRPVRALNEPRRSSRGHVERCVGGSAPRARWVFGSPLIRCVHGNDREAVASARTGRTGSTRRASSPSTTAEDEAGRDRRCHRPSSCTH
jgi:hypothetical protein